MYQLNLIRILMEHPPHLNQKIFYNLQTKYFPLIIHCLMIYSPDITSGLPSERNVLKPEVDIFPI